MKHRIIPAIMSGGAGTRLWPLSTDQAPKQFHALAAPGSLFERTAERVQGDAGDIAFAPPIVLCNQAHAAAARAALQEAGVKPAAVVLEPAARNTAAVAAVAAALAQEIDPDALVLLLPADHIVTSVPAFHAALVSGAPHADENIVMLGIAPDRPATGYGYVKRGRELSEDAYAVDSFREKPNAAMARQYLSEGGYYWNSGMFLFRPRVLLKEFSASADIRDRALEALKSAVREGDEIRLGDVYQQVPAQPLDIAVMEKTAHAVVVACDIGWADIGSWDEIWRLSLKDASGNAIEGPVVALDSSNNLLRGEGVKVCVAGVEGLIVVATPEAVIVLPRERAQDVKLLRELGLKL